MTSPATLIRRAIVLAFAGALALWTAGDHSAPSVSAKTPEMSAPTGAAEPTIYALDVPLVDQHGRTLTLTEFRGRPLVATMVYTSCRSVCPTITEELKAIERRLPAPLKSDVVFAMFSLDPGRDTPSALQEFAVAHRLDDRTWRLLAASEDDIRVLSAVLGVRYQRVDEGEIAHSAVILAIDRDGVVRGRRVGPSGDLQPLVAALGRTDR